MSRVMIEMNELIDEISMGPFGSDIKVDNFVETGVPVLNGSNVTGVRLAEESFNYVTPEKAKSLKKANAKRGDIIITHRGTLGQIAFIPENSLYDNYIISQSQFKVRLKANKVDPAYFTYYFHTNEGQKRLLSFKNHVGVPALAQATTNFRKLEFPLIPLFEQQKIAKVLSDLDAKIELNNKINEELEAMAKTLYEYWFVQFDFPDKNEKPYKSSGGIMVWNEELKREIPDGWEVVKISELAPVITGKQDANFATNNGAYNFFTCGEEVLKCDSYEFEGKSILIAGNGNFNVKLYDGKFNAYQRTYILIPEDEKFYTLIYLVIKDRISSFKNGSRGSIVKFITKGDIENIQIPLPKDEKKDLFHKINLTTELIEKNIKQNQKLASLRDWLLPMLMNGQVSVASTSSATPTSSATEEQLDMVAESGEEYKRS